MYEKLKIELVWLREEDIVRTSPVEEWKDENADSNGWL